MPGSVLGNGVVNEIRSLPHDILNGSTQEGNVTYPGFVHMGVQEGFLEKGPGLLTISESILL